MNIRHPGQRQIPPSGHRAPVCLRCVELLKREAFRPLLALVAPPGYGKTTLLAAWAAALPAESAIGWLALNEEDNEVGRFLSRAIRALPVSGDGRSGKLPELRQGEEGAERPLVPQALLDAFLRTLDTAEEVHLFFDQYEAIREPAVHRIVEQIAANAGERVHLYIASREALPFFPAIRRLQPGPLLVTHEHLKLDEAEIGAWLGQRTQLKPPAELLRRLVRCTEGWPMALELFASFMDGSRALPPEEEAAIDAVQTGLQDVFLQDILLRQPEALQRFMLCTSLPDRFDAELAGWLTGDSACHRHIERMLRHNLLLFHDGVGQYRYHPLFVRFLRTRFSQLDKDGFAAGQERMIAWLTRHVGVDEAVRHALRIPDYDRASALLLEDIAATFSYPKPTIIELLQQFPHAELGGRPSIAMIYAWFLAAEHRTALAETVLDQAELRMTGDSYVFPPTGENLRGYFASIRSRIHYRRRDAEKGMALMKETEALLNGPGYLYSHFNTIDPEGYSLLKSDAGHWGAIDQTIAMCEYAEPAWKGVNQGYGMIRILLGECHYERNRLSLAEEHLLQGRKIALDLRDSGLFLPASLALVQLKRARGEYRAAQTMLQETRKLAAAGQFGDKARSALDACQARLAMKAGQPNAVRDWLRRQPKEADTVPQLRDMYESLTLLRAYVFFRQTESGLTFGERLLHFSESWYLPCYIAEIEWLLAVLYEAKGEKSTAFRKLERALTIGQREGYVQLFLDEWETAEQLLLKYGNQPRLRTKSAASEEARPFYRKLLQHSTEKALDDDKFLYAQRRLTPKEFKVLQCLIAGKSNAAIAAELSIRIETAKTHCKSIYRKLQLQSRKEVRRFFADD